jgi:hypothetical protein
MATVTARQRVLIESAKAKAAAAKNAAEQEKADRSKPISVTATGYDPTVGDYLVETPDGGTLRARSLTNGALIGRRLPLQRFDGSQTTNVNAPPTDADAGWILAEMEAMQRDLVRLSAVQLSEDDPVDAGSARYDGDKWLNFATNALYIWVAGEDEWQQVSGSAVIYGNGNPNGRIANQDDLVPWVSGGQYYDMTVSRLFVATPGENDHPKIKWFPIGTVTWDESRLANYAAESGIYEGDIYQGPDTHDITDAEGGMFYRFSNGSWKPQFTCCDDVPTPPGEPCQPSWNYGFYNSSEGYTRPDLDIYFPCT